MPAGADPREAVLLLRQLPFVGRQPVRETVFEMVRPDGWSGMAGDRAEQGGKDVSPRTLLLSPTGSLGLRSAGQRDSRAREGLPDDPAGAGPAPGPGDRAAGREVPGETARAEGRSVGERPGLVQAGRRICPGGRTWIVLDGFDHPDVPQESHSFIATLADEASRRADLRLVLLGYSPELPPYIERNSAGALSYLDAWRWSSSSTNWTGRVAIGPTPGWRAVRPGRRPSDRALPQLPGRQRRATEGGRDGPPRDRPRRAPARGVPARARRPVGSCVMIPPADHAAATDAERPAWDGDRVAAFFEELKSASEAPRLPDAPTAFHATAAIPRSTRDAQRLDGSPRPAGDGCAGCWRTPSPWPMPGTSSIDGASGFWPAAGSLRRLPHEAGGPGGARAQRASAGRPAPGAARRLHHGHRAADRVLGRGPSRGWPPRSSTG